MEMIYVNKTINIPQHNGLVSKTHSGRNNYLLFKYVNISINMLTRLHLFGPRWSNHTQQFIYFNKRCYVCK